MHIEGSFKHCFILRRHLYLNMPVQQQFTSILLISYHPVYQPNLHYFKLVIICGLEKDLFNQKFGLFADRMWNDWPNFE